MGVNCPALEMSNHHAVTAKPPAGTLEQPMLCKPLWGAAHHDGPPSSHRAARGGHGAGAKGSSGGAVHALSSSAAWEVEHSAATGRRGQAAAWNLPMPPRRCEEEPSSFLQEPSGKSCLTLRLKWMPSNVGFLHRAVY